MKIIQIEPGKAASAVFHIFLFFILASAGPALGKGAPALYIEKDIYNFGTILEGKEIPYDFIIENRGTEILEITDVRSNCVCAVADYTEKIPPGKSGKISVVFDSRGSGGLADHKIRVETNDPKHEAIGLSITGNVDPIVVIEPKKAVLEGVAGENVETVLTITSDPRHLFKILSVTSKKDKVSCRLEEIENTESSCYRLTLTSLSREKGNFRDYVYMETDSDIRPGITITVKGEIH